MSVELNTNALITKDELDTFLQITIGDTDYSNTLINFASDFIESYCNRVLINAKYTREAYDGDGEEDLYVNNPPILEPSGVIIESWNTYDDSLSQTYTEHTEFMIYDDYLYMRGKWAKGRKNFRITYNGGYDPIPYDLKKACADLCSLMKENKDKANIKSERTGKYSVTYGIDTATIGGIAIPSEILSLLINYRIINI